MAITKQRRASVATNKRKQANKASTRTYRDGTTAREWLRTNGYEDIVQIIDEAMQEWASKGIKTRRNWWELLAGTKNGQPRTLHGREFPVLRVAQKRQGLPVTANAIERTTREKAPSVRDTNRWPNKD